MVWINKKGILLTALVLVCFTTYSQNFNEFFRQKKTQQTYLVKQLAALKIYAEALKNGYAIVENGLSSISDFSDEEKDLHQIYFDSLKIVNPELKKEPTIAQLKFMHRQIRATFNEIGKLNFAAIHQQFFIAMAARVNAQSEHYLTQMILLITDGKLQMSHQQRLDRLKRLFVEMSELFHSVLSIHQQAIALDQVSKNKRNQLNLLRNLYEKN